MSRNAQTADAAGLAGRSDLPGKSTGADGCCGASAGVNYPSPKGNGLLRN